MASERAAEKRVVVIGAGFAGLAAAKELATSSLAVTLIDAHNFHTFQPLLYQVATAGLDPADVAFPVRAIFPCSSNVSVLRGRVERIDTEGRNVVLSDRSSVPYDMLVVATGATSSFFSIDGAAAHAMPLYTLRDARALRNKLLSVLEEADAHPENYRDGALRFVIVGGGATGVEISGALVELLDISVRRDRLRIDRERTTITILDTADRLLTAFGERSSRYALEALMTRGVKVRLDQAVASVDDGAVHLADGSSMEADVVIWAAGVSVEGTLAASLPGTGGRGGRRVIEDDLSLAGHPEISVIGDAAAVPTGTETGALAPQVAQVAMQSGRHAARQIVARLEGRPSEPFSYLDKGIMATIGRRSAVAQLEGPGPLRGVVLSGTPGWLAWLGLHLIYLVGVRNRLVVLTNWLWRYVGWAAGPRIIVEDEPDA